MQVPGGARAYSLCNPPDAREGYQLAIHRSSAHGGAHYLCETLAVGSPLRVRGPRNLFALSPEHRRVVLIAGGIGITPIIAMAEHLARRDLDFQMHYCARSRAAAAFLDRLDAGACRHRVRYHFDDDPAGAFEVLAARSAGASSAAGLLDRRRARPRRRRCAACPASRASVACA